MVQALPLFYSRVSHQKIQQILSEVWNVFHCEEVKLHNMKKTVLSYTCVTGNVQKLIHYPLCLQWFNTFSLSCPKYSNNDTRITDSNSFRLSLPPPNNVQRILKTRLSVIWGQRSVQCVVIYPHECEGSMHSISLQKPLLSITFHLHLLLRCLDLTRNRFFKQWTRPRKQASTSFLSPTMHSWFMRLWVSNIHLL